MIQKLPADCLLESQNDLGEGPLWHPVENRLYWVDITAGNLYRSTQDMKGFNPTHFETTLGAFGFTAQGGFILAAENGFALWRPGDQQPKTLWQPIPARSGVRMNDGKVGPAGRFWAGSMDIERQQGCLYRIDPDGSQHTLLRHIGISNGLGWSPDHKTLYYTDSFRNTIYAYDFDLTSGQISSRRVFVRLPKTPQEIVPDGLCVDAEGCVWSAQWNGWQVVRYDPKGQPILKVAVPAQRVTSCCFGGQNLDHLFITSARTGLTEAELANQPLAGSIFQIQTNTQGQPVTFFPG